MIKTPLHRVTVKPFDVDEWDEGRKKAKAMGLVLPDADSGNVRAKASVDMGEIVQVGPTAYKDYGVEPPAVGSTVAYVKNSGKFVKDPFTGIEYLVLNDEDIVMVFEKE